MAIVPPSMTRPEFVSARSAPANSVLEPGGEADADAEADGRGDGADRERLDGDAEHHLAP